MKSKVQFKRGSEDRSRAGSRGVVVPRPGARTTRHQQDLHFEFPESDRALQKAAVSHRRVSSTDTGPDDRRSQLLRVYSLIRSAYGSLPEVSERVSEEQVLQHIEAGVVLTMAQLAAKDQEIQELKAEGGLTQEHLKALQGREEAVSAQEAELKSAWTAFERERSETGKLQSRLKAMERHVKSLQNTQTLASLDVQARLKALLNQESLLNAVAEDLQYQRCSLLTRLESTLAEASPEPSLSESLLKDCSNLLSTRSKSKGSTQDSTRLSKAADITEIYSELEDPLEVTPKGVLTPTSLCDGLYAS